MILAYPINWRCCTAVVRECSDRDILSARWMPDKRGSTITDKCFGRVMWTGGKQPNLSRASVPELSKRRIRRTYDLKRLPRYDERQPQD